MMTYISTAFTRCPCRQRVPERLRFTGEEDLPLPVPRVVAHLLGSLQGDGGHGASRTLKHALHALHRLYTGIQPDGPQGDVHNGRPDRGAVHPPAPSSTEPRDGEMRLAPVSPPSLSSGEDRRSALLPPTDFALFFTTRSGWVSLDCGWQHSPKSPPRPEAVLFCEPFNQEAFTLSLFAPFFVY